MLQRQRLNIDAVALLVMLVVSNRIVAVTRDHSVCKDGNKLFWTMDTNSLVSKKCFWLKDLDEEDRYIICNFDDSRKIDGVWISPARDICRLMCDSCETELFYSSDGRDNNVAYPFCGSVGQPTIRSYPPLNGYVDGISIPQNDLPSAHKIVTKLFEIVPPRDNKKISQLFVYYG